MRKNLQRKLWQIATLWMFIMILSPFAKAGQGDTTRVMTWVNDEYVWPVTHVETFTGFPDSSKTFRKIILRYTLGCASGGCDPWDVGAPIHAVHNLPGGGTEDIEIARYITPYAKTGVWDFDVTDYHMLFRDSVTLKHRNASYTSGNQGYKVTMEFIFIEGTPPREALDIQRLWQGGYNYGINTVGTRYELEPGNPPYAYVWDKYLTINSTISLTSGTVGSGSVSINQVAGASAPDSRTQILIRASELTSAGINPGNITGLAFDAASAGSMLHQLTLSMRHTAQTALSTMAIESTGFTKVYQANTTFTTGTNTLQFTTPFLWNGTDNLLLDVVYDNSAIGTDNLLNGNNAGYNSLLSRRDNDYYISFQDTASVVLPGTGFSSIDSFITVAFWVNGDLNLQPQNDQVFEAIDATGNRVLNCHLPWGNGRIYWDAGNDGGGSSDRIEQFATPDMYKYFWNHYALTKNVATGEMNIYRNGTLWFSGTGKTRRMYGIDRFRIGSNAVGTAFYDGKIDEFQVWNVALDATTIQDWMNRKITATHPNYSNLVAYYCFNEGTGTSIADSGPMGNNASTPGTVVWQGHNRQPAANRYPDDVVSMNRPNIRFEQGNYLSQIDSILVDSTPVYVVNTYPVYNHFDSITPPMTVTVPPNAVNTALKFRTTGHGFGGNANCAEFCQRIHTIKVNGTSWWDHNVWNDDCGMNACYPQGGTWIYDRAGWCPGEDVETFDVEMTPVMPAGATVTLDYSAPDYTWNGSGSTPNWSLANHLIYYDAPSFTNDAEVWDIISPNNKFIHNRFNPICRKPEIQIRNSGTAPLTSLKIHYMVEGGVDSVFNWTGNLPFLEKTKVTLGELNWNGSGNTFKVWVSEPNGTTDQYAWNDTMRSTFTTPPSYPNDIYLLWKTNNAGSETRYQLKDIDGNVLYEQSPFIGPNTTFRDTFQLPQGCYTFRLYDTGKDGLSFFANSDGSGFARLMSVPTGNALVTFNPDFGTQVLQDFTVDTPLETRDAFLQPKFDAFPNPTNGSLTIRATFANTQESQVKILDMMGQTVLSRNMNAAQSWEEQLDMSGLADGIYFVKLDSGKESVTRKIVLRKTE